jgi:dephospho-CoA kinase
LLSVPADENAKGSGATRATAGRQPVIGLIGGIGSGKSAVARILGDLGAAVIDSDRLGHEEINRHEVRDEFVRWWGPSVLAADGSVDRAKVAAIVFADAEERRRLESLLHPRIDARRVEIMRGLRGDPSVRMIVLDTPLLLEAKVDRHCDVIIFVDASWDRRLERSEMARNWPKGELKRRENLQMPLDAKRSRADYICENNSTFDDLRNQLRRIVASIVAD